MLPHALQVLSHSSIFPSLHCTLSISIGFTHGSLLSPAKFQSSRILCPICLRLSGWSLAIKRAHAQTRAQINGLGHDVGQKYQASSWMSKSGGQVGVFQVACLYARRNHWQKPGSDSVTLHWHGNLRRIHVPISRLAFLMLS
jgi:hypothetical protein